MIGCHTAQTSDNINDKCCLCHSTDDDKVNMIRINGETDNHYIYTCDDIWMKKKQLKFMMSVTTIMFNS